MAVLMSPGRGRLRFGLGPGLVAAGRGLAFAGVALAGLVQLLVVLAAPVFIALGAGMLIVGNGGNSKQRMLLTLVLLLTGLGIGYFGLPAALLGLRRLARLTRRLATEWCGVPIAEAYRPRPAGPLTYTQRLGWLLTDRATWRDLLWMAISAIAGWILAAASAVIIGVGLIGFVGPELVRTIPPPAFAGNSAGSLIVLGLAITTAGVYAAPALLRGYGLLASSMLAPGHALLERRVQQLTETRTEALDTGAAEIRRIERDLHDGAQARLVAMGMTLDAAGQIISTNPEAARALLYEARDASVKALAELRALIRGIHPPVLADRGLAEAVRALALDSPVRVTLASDLTGRPPAPVESAAYFAVSELLANVAKHATARQAWIDIRHLDQVLRIGVTDDGRGGAEPARGTGLLGIERRLAPFDGVLAVSSPPGGPTAVTMEIPCALSSAKISSC
jgi:signal transduction histidine kinase